HPVPAREAHRTARALREDITVSPGEPDVGRHRPRAFEDVLLSPEKRKDLLSGHIRQTPHHIKPGNGPEICSSLKQKLTLACLDPPLRHREPPVSERALHHHV